MMTAIIKKYRVLAVDDDREFLDDLSIMLSGDMEMRLAQSSKEGMRLLEEIIPDCLLLDLSMPMYFGTESSNEGIAFLEYLRKHKASRSLRNMPVIIITGSLQEQHSNKIRRLGVDTIIGKPPNIMELKRKILEVIKKSGN